MTAVAKLKPTPKVENPSGIAPTEFKVLILPDDTGKTHKFVGKDGKTFELHKADTSIEQQQFAQMEGTLIAVAEHAFSYADFKVSQPPKPGDRVIYCRYAGGNPIKGKDGKDYRIVNDKDVIAVLV